MIYELGIWTTMKITGDPIVYLLAGEQTLLDTLPGSGSSEWWTMQDHPGGKIASITIVFGSEHAVYLHTEEVRDAGEVIGWLFKIDPEYKDAIAYHDLFVART